MTPRHISQFFTFAHLQRADLRDLSKKFADVHDTLLAAPVPTGEALEALAADMRAELPTNPETAVCLDKLRWARGLIKSPRGRSQLEETLRLLLEAKDCAVRALLAGPLVEVDPEAAPSQVEA